VFGVLVVVGSLVWWQLPTPSTPTGAPVYVGNETPETMDGVAGAPRVEVIAENLTIPWEVLFLPDGELLITERPGNVLLLKRGVTIPLEGVRHVGEGGLLGAALHPGFETNNFIYFYQTTDTEAGIKNRIVRYTLTGDQLTFDQEILADIPGAWYHDGGRLAFGPDGMLYATVGDATDADSAQDTATIAGSIIRLTPEGAVPADNPLPGSYIYSYGHRNPQGLAWTAEGQLWSSEHGRSVGGSGFDEINRIEPGANYGWPDSQGDTVAPGTVAPARHSTADVTWAPGGLAYLDGRLYMPGLRGATLYVAELTGEEITGWQEYLVGEYGRLRTVQVGPDSLLYLLTSNRDGRGDTPAETDDKLIRINPALLEG
jgi:glucose/arabinose dehydrogenase